MDAGLLSSHKCWKLLERTWDVLAWGRMAAHKPCLLDAAVED
jgi:hypothetical protein